MGKLHPCDFLPRRLWHKEDLVFSLFIHFKTLFQKKKVKTFSTCRYKPRTSHSFSNSPSFFLPIGHIGLTVEEEDGGGCRNGGETTQPT